MTDRFPFRFDPRYAKMLLLLGIRPGTAEVVVSDDTLGVRFGPWRLTTSLDNITGASVEGPHRPIKAIGTRLSFGDRGLTFGSDVQRTTCIEFRDPVPGIEPLGLIRHPNLSVSVQDPEALAARLRRETS